MKFNLDVQGMEKLMNDLADLQQEIPAAVARTGNFVVQSTAQRVKNKIRTEGRSGRIWNGHQASAPGEPPANFTGRLADSYKYTRMTDNVRSSATVGSNLAYARVLEYGGYVRRSPQFGGGMTYIEPRPVLVPSFYEALAQARTKLQAEVRKVL